MASSKTLIPCLALVVFLSMISFTESREFLVGSKNDSWQIPSSPDVFNNWAKNIRFQIGDSIVFEYDGKSDSVVRVSDEDYIRCNKSNPIKSYNDGNTKILLHKSGPFYYISGAEGHCEKGQKLEIRVLSAKHSHPPAPSPSENHHHHHHAPAPAPHNAASTLKLGLITIVLAILSLL
ncbi:hypothetical protein ACS0TY_024308 [Phlomoides rotata]